jgi:hypothetical protein
MIGTVDKIADRCGRENDRALRPRQGIAGEKKTMPSIKRLASGEQRRIPSRSSFTQKPRPVLAAFSYRYSARNAEQKLEKGANTKGGSCLFKQTQKILNIFGFYDIINKNFGNKNV